MLGRGAAAPADHAHVVQDEAPRVRCHVFRRAQVEIAPLDVARAPGVGLGREPQLRDGGHPLDGVEHRRRPDRAVDTEQGGTTSLEVGREPLGWRPVERVPVFLGGHLRDDRQVRDPADGVDGGANLVQVAERLQNEQVDPAFHERPRLFLECVARLVDTGLSPRLDPDPERTDRSGHVGATRSGRARDPRPLHIDRAQPVAEPERPELGAVRPERVGLDDVRPGSQVLIVHFAHQLGRRDIEGVEALVDEHALGVQHRSHGAIADKDPAV